MKPRLLLVMSVIGLTCASTRAADEAGSCTLTSQAALRSCQEGARSDFWLARGKCANVSDPAERKACEQQAPVDLRDASNLCNAQYSVRQTACQRLGGQPYDPVIDPRELRRHD